MKKFLPYIFITAFVGAFLMISFSPLFSRTFSGTSSVEVEASIGIKKILGALIYSSVGIFTIADLVGWGDWGSMADATFGNVVKWISSLTWYLSAKLFTLSGYLLDYAVDFSVKDFKKNIENIGIVTQGYKILLNFANMVFIFLLLYIAIKTILGEGGDTKKLLTRIIIVALMINFSLFMTKVIIDASNIVAMGFYNAIQTEAGKAKIEGSEKEQKLISVGSVSTAMMAGLRLQTLLPAYDSEYNKKDTTKGFSNLNMAVNQFGGSALFLVTAFAFFSVSFLFFVRFITLLFYMMLSPVAFLGYISPELKSYSSDWWKGLQNQVIFAPVFLFFAYLISSLVNSGQLWEAVGGNSGSSQTFYDTISSSGQLGFSIILNYVILIALMIGGLVTAKKMASVGSHGAVGYAQKFQGWAQGMMGRNAIGRPSEYANKGLDTAKEYLEERKWGRVLLGATKYGSLGLAGGARDLIRKGETSDFGSGQSRKDVKGTRVEEVAGGLTDRRSNPERMATYMAGLWPSERKAAYDKMSARDRAAIEAAWDKTHATAPQKTKDLFKGLREKLSIEEQEKTEKAKKDADTDKKNRENKDDIHRVATGQDKPGTTPLRPYTPAEIDTLMRELKNNQARKLSHEARVSPIIIPKLTVRHLGDLMAEGNITSNEIAAIRANATATQLAWMTGDPTRDAQWTP